MRRGSQRHPRTNVGVTDDGRVLMVTVDGRQPGYSVGVSLAEMGQLMTSLGARDSFNFDGGGSTVMARRFLADGRFAVTNRPSDGREAAGHPGPGRVRGDRGALTSGQACWRVGRGVGSRADGPTWSRAGLAPGAALTPGRY